MRAIIQRVGGASVSVDNQVVSSIGPGYCVFLGIKSGDTTSDSSKLVDKILKAQLFSGSDDYSSSAISSELPTNERDKLWRKNILEVRGDILIVSQFTLFAKLIRGKRPDFHDAMNPATAKKLYEDFIELLKAEMEAKEKYSSIRVKTGVFGEIMDIELQNKGPVTISVES